MTRFVVAGSVSTTLTTLRALASCGAEIVGVLGLRPESAGNVSGYVDLEEVAHGLGIPFLAFSTINEEEVVAQVQSWAPDYVFVVGLSQLVKPALLNVAGQYCIGFHPTRLPEGRGRAPIAWLVIEQQPGAATLFVIDEGTDSGMVLESEPFHVDPGDYAADVLGKANIALETALLRLIPRLMIDDAIATPQDETRATYFGKRTPEDGLVDWNKSVDEICRLVRGTSKPHPGAYTLHAGSTLTIWKAEPERSWRGRGTPGSILALTAERHLVVQAGDGLIRLTEVEGNGGGIVPKAGDRLGISPQAAIHALTQRVAKLESALERLLTQSGSHI